MAESPDEILARWRKRIPPQVPREEVIAVVKRFFPEHHRFHTDGSHFLIVTHPALVLAAAHGALAGCTRGTLSLSLVHGKTVKKWQIDDLLQAIEAKETYDRINNE